MDLPSSITICFEGDSGDGIISMGKVVARSAARLGYHVYTYSTFLAVVRGGQVTFQLRLGKEPLLSQGNEPDILVALNGLAVKEKGMTVRRNGIVLHPPFGDHKEAISPEAKDFTVDYKEIAVNETGAARGKNMVAVGVVSGMLGLDEETTDTVVREMFAGKGSDVTVVNANAFAAGYDEGQELAEHAGHLHLDPPEERCRRMLISGNEAVALGALAAGVRFYAGYPITPASEIMEWLATQLPKAGGIMFQAEDEIAALGMCIGASFGGVKTMTATSGPGLSLMIELLGLAGMAEIPIVVVDVQRAGPSTGMPTKEAQGDLILAAQGTHGEIPRVVIAPQTVSDCFEHTARAVSIAHEFHMPVIVLSSQSLSHRMQTLDLEELRTAKPYEEVFFKPDKTNANEPFLRYREQSDGLASMRSIPGTKGGMYRSGGLEHDESGKPNFEPSVRTRMVERRRNRMRAVARTFRQEIPRSGSETETSPLALMSWGASAPVAMEAINDLLAEGIPMRYMFPEILWPMPDIAISSFLSSGIKYLFVCELNASRQFAEMLRGRYTVDIVENDIEVISIIKDEGLPFTPGEIKRGVMHALEHEQWRPLEVAK